MRRRTAKKRAKQQSKPKKEFIELRLCGAKLGCGHHCQLKSVHRNGCDCKVRCEYKSPCGHQCINRCSSSHKHPRKCRRSCIRTCLCGQKCNLTCQDPCSPCRAKCPIECGEQKCKAQCYDWIGCHMPKGCVRPCWKRCKICSKTCLGLCGHPCPPCSACTPFKCPISLETFDQKSKWPLNVYMLVDCGCTFETNSIDTYMKGAAGKALGAGEFRIKCPQCSTPITKSWRYADAIRQCLYQNPPPIPNSEPRKKPSKKELKSICSVMAPLYHDISYPWSHWYTCANGHPYYVGDCGEATQGGRCYECKVPIGSFDKSTAKRWGID